MCIITGIDGIQHRGNGEMDVCVNAKAVGNTEIQGIRVRDWVDEGSWWVAELRATTSLL